MRKLLIVALIFATPVGVLSQQTNNDTLLIQSIRVEKINPELKSGKWITGTTALSSVQKFDDAGNLVESVVYGGNGDVYLNYSAKYSDADLKTEDTYFDTRAKSSRKTIYQYDGNKKLIGMLYFDTKDIARGESTVRYKNGRINELITYGARGVVTARVVYTYYDDVRKLEARYYDDAGFSRGGITTFDDQGRVKESKSYELEESDGSRSVYQYDKDGYITEQVLYVGSGMVTWRYTYAFDGHGHWITRTITPISDSSNESDRQPIDITQRTIIYGSKKDKHKPSMPRSVAHYVESDIYESLMYGYVRKRNINTSKFSGYHLMGQAKVFIMINELGKVILTIPFGRLTSVAGKVSVVKVHKIMDDIIKDWKYTPTVQDGEPRIVTGQINFNFILK